MRQKNLVLICADQMRYDALRINGNPMIRTPNIDAIGARGTTFDQHYTPNQICSPSRATMATGRYPRHHGLWRNGVALSEGIPTLWQTLASGGYATHAVGKLHFQPLQAPRECNMPESLAFWDVPGAEQWTGPFYGFDHVDLVLGEANESTKAGHYAAWLKSTHPEVVRLYEPEASLSARAHDLPEVWKSAVPASLHYTQWIADKARGAIARYAGAEPFALFVSFPDPHHPFAPPEPYCDRYRPEDVPQPSLRTGELDRMPAYLEDTDDPQKAAYIGEGETVREQGFLLRTDAISKRTLNEVIAHTYGMVEMIDDAVGDIVRALEIHGILDDTLIAFTSDHGELLGDHGLLRKGPPPYRQLLQVPLVLAGPDVGTISRCKALTSHIDLFATFASLLDVEAPVTDGHDLAPVIRGKVDDVRDWLFAEYHPRRDRSLYNQTVITRHWRYTRYPNQPSWGEMFNRLRDPWEHWNVFGDADHGDDAAILEQLLGNHMPPQLDLPTKAIGAY